MNLVKSSILCSVLCSIILCLTGIGNSSLPDALPLQWGRSTPLPEPRSDYGGGALDGRLVIAGGTYWEGSKGHWVKKHFSASTHAFNPVSRVWVKLPDLPTPLACAASVVIGNRLFVLGGYTGSHVNRNIYSLQEESGNFAWRSVGALPVDRLFAGAASVGTRLFLLGGTTQFEPLDSTGTCCTSRTATTSFMVLDTARPEKGWSQLAALPGPRRWFFSTIADEKSIWMFGGRFQANPQDPLIDYNQVYRYDIAQARWKEMKPLPEKSPNAAPPSPVIVKGKIILVADTGKVWELDPMTMAYRDLARLPEATSVDKFVWLSDGIIGAGGENNLEGPRRRSDTTFIGRFGAK
jgi:hypothetical protein